jgi:pyruvate formate lyase activating enzyme
MAELMVGLRKTSLVDYPGRIAATLFIPGCNLRCPWCHNKELVEPGYLVTAQSLSAAEVHSPAGCLENTLALVPFSQALEIIQKRKNVLGGVAITGGEPTLRPELPDIVAAIHRLGLDVKLDTNGTLPLSLEKLLREDETRPDYVAMDLKLAPDRYRELLPGCRLSAHKLAAHEPQKISDEDSHASPGQNLRRSAELLRQYGIPYEFRTLALPGSFITEKDIEELAALVDESPWYFAGFRGGNCLDPQWDYLEEPSRHEVETLAQLARKFGKNALLRLLA